MNQVDRHKDFHHALTVYNELCTGCTHCMSVCPTKAIRVSKGKARIIASKCVDCGNCYKACPVSAIQIEHDDLNMIFNYSVRVILIPSVLIGQFSEKAIPSGIYKALKEIGFTHVYQVENSVSMVLEAYREYSGLEPIRPLISSFCPAIVRLIQVKHPLLVGNLMKVNPPIDMSALYYREKLKAEGIPPEDIGIFYATPCAAKVAAIKSPVGGNESGINGVINMNQLYNRIQKFLRAGKNDTDLPQSDDLLGPEGIMWSLTGGELAHCSERALAIDGIANVSEILESVENEKLGGIDFLELRACDESCAGGILVNANRFLVVEKLKNLAATYQGRSQKELPEAFSKLKEHSYLGSIEPRPIEKLDEDIQAALRKMERKRRLMCFLPGFDCGACGAPDCQTLAEDVVQGKAQISHCIFMQQQMINQNLLSQEKAYRITEDVWGKERLEKNCNKIGAEDENI